MSEDGLNLEEESLKDWRASQNTAEEEPEDAQEPAADIPAAQPAKKRESTPRKPRQKETPPEPRFSLEEMRTKAAQSLQDIGERASEALHSVQIPEGLKNLQQKGAEALELIREKGLEGVIQDLKDRVQAELQKEKEGAEYNLTLAKVLAKEASKSLAKKLEGTEPHLALAAVWFGLHALVFGGATILKVESLIPDQGTLLDGLKLFMDGINGIEASVPANAAIFSGMSLGALKLNYDIRELRKEESKDTRKTKKK